MKEKSQRLCLLCYRVFLGVFTFVIAGLLFGTLISFWTAQSSPLYSYETVSLAFRDILMIPGILWILAVIAGGVLSYLYPAPKAKGKNDIRYNVRRLRKKLPQSGDAEELAALKKCKLIRNLVWLAAAIVILICIICAIVYLSDISNYHATEPNVTMWNAFIHVFPLIAVSFAIAVGAGIWEGQSAKREMTLIRAYNVNHRPVGKDEPAEKPSELVAFLTAAEQTGSNFKRKLAELARKVVLFFESPNGKLIVRCVLAAVGVALVVWGICNGGMNDVLKKAVNICTECIGLG